MQDLLQLEAASENVTSLITQCDFLHHAYNYVCTLHIIVI